MDSEIPRVQSNETDLSRQIAGEIIADIEAYVDQHLEKYQKYTLNAPSIHESSLSSTSAAESTSKFFNLISSLKDVSLLGQILLDSAPQFSDPSGALVESSSSDDFLVLSSSLESITVKDMVTTTLLYIKSHECFTLSQDIQSVAIVLKRTKFMILNVLAPKDQMELIIKLLTSIGRYNEMNYVFDLFRDRNQFEILLSKGVEKTPELRIALFNYGKKNPEFYQLVTLNFSMFGEIGESLEASATRRLSELVAGNKRPQAAASAASRASAAAAAAATTTAPSCQESATTTPETNQAKLTKSGSTPNTTANVAIYPKDSLNVSLVELADASDCYAKAGCYKRSNYCERKAKLIALQLALLSRDGTNVLDLAQSELTDLIVSFKTFSEAYIVAEAYDYHLAWRQALFKNVILRGQSGYLAGFCKKCDLSTVLVEELVLLYKQYINNHNNQPSREERCNLAKAMKMVLSRLDDVELKCKIYSQLNFDDAKEELLRDSATQAHLKDLKLA